MMNHTRPSRFCVDAACSGVERAVPRMLRKRLSAGSQTVLPTVRFSPATSVEFTPAANRRVCGNTVVTDSRCRLTNREPG